MAPVSRFGQCRAIVPNGSLGSFTTGLEAVVGISLGNRWFPRFFRTQSAAADGTRTRFLASTRIERHFRST